MAPKLRGDSVRVKHLRILLSAFAAALLGFFVVAAASGAGTIDIVPMGDSITAQGQYVPYLETALTIEGYQCTEIANEGYSGYVIAQQYTISGSTYTSPRSGLLETLPGSLSDPRVNSPNTDILLMIGTNDVDTGFDLVDYDVQYRMGLLDLVDRGPRPAGPPDRRPDHSKLREHGQRCGRATVQPRRCGLGGDREPDVAQRQPG